MMNLPKKRSASPPIITGPGASPTLTAMAGGAATQEEYDTLTAMHILKRQRLAQAAAAGYMNDNTPLFRPTSLMDMNMSAAMATGGMSNTHHHLFGGSSSHMNPMNPAGPALFHPGSSTSRLRSTLATTAPLSPYSNMSSGALSPMSTAHPLAWRAAAMNQADMFPVLPTIPGHSSMAAAAAATMHQQQQQQRGAAFMAMDADCHRTSSPSNFLMSQRHQQEAAAMNQRHQQEAAAAAAAGLDGLDQLSSFASHMPTIPAVPRTVVRKTSLDPPPSSSSSVTATNISNSSNNNGDVEVLRMCAPVNSSSSSPPPPLPLKTILKAKKLTKPIQDTTMKAPQHWEDRPFVPLAIDEDANWLSEFQCFLRSEILEVFVASPRDLETRAMAGASKKKISTAQVGIRCRFCAHLHPTERASRASAFPSSVRQIYQSFTMMLREHLNGQCEAFPEDIKQHFLKLKGQSAQSASDSKRYWIYAAQRLGMVDTPEAGIQMTDSPAESSSTTTAMKPFGASPEVERDLKVALSSDQEPLVIEADEPVVAEFTQAVVSQAVRVHLAASEKIGNRSCLTVGLPGLACKHCALKGRSGLSRVFPARKRNLKTKVHDLYDHLRRCPLCPESVKEELRQKLSSDSDKKSKVFYARLWRRLGHEENDFDASGKSPLLESTVGRAASGGNISPIPSSSL